MRLSFSVIVPVYNQWQFIPGLIDKLRLQSYGVEDVEVLLVDNGSSELQVPDELPENVRVLYCEDRGSYAARNFGARFSSGNWLVFTDADCLPETEWLEQIARAISSSNGENRIIAGGIDSYCEEVNPTLYEIYDIVRGIPQERYVSHGYGATANLTVPRKAIDMLEGFNHQLYSGGDADFCRRARNQGFDIVYVSSALAQHRTRSSWEEIATKARRVKGGQLVCKPLKYRAWIVLRTLLSPLVTTHRFVSEKRYTLRYRLIASFIYLRVWGVELVELVRVGSGREPERR
ncbi:glycosyltransferase [Microbulbifer elongatus]|uniref:glycosyltransferase n=1 Tax=Microbulbifer elongatus TaxID=86173 RepID=UPI001E64D99E|nr:glycosyltransferase [Microbulbifer elongatus]